MVLIFSKERKYLLIVYAMLLIHSVFIYCWLKTTRIRLCIWIHYSVYIRIMFLSYIVKFLKALLVIKYMILLKFFFHLVYIVGELHFLQSCSVCSDTALLAEPVFVCLLSFLTLSVTDCCADVVFYKWLSCQWTLNSGSVRSIIEM